MRDTTCTHTRLNVRHMRTNNNNSNTSCGQETDFVRPPRRDGIECSASYEDIVGPIRAVSPDLRLLKLMMIK